MEHTEIGLSIQYLQTFATISHPKLCNIQKQCALFYIIVNEGQPSMIFKFKWSQTSQHKLKDMQKYVSKMCSL